MRAYDAYFRRSLDNGVSWGPKIKISNSGTISGNPVELAASGSNVYVVWYDHILHPDESCDNTVYFRKGTSSGGTWGSKVILVSYDNSSCIGSEFNPLSELHEEPTQVVAKSSSIYIATQRYLDDDHGDEEDYLKFNIWASSNGGSNWSVSPPQDTFPSTHHGRIVLVGSNIYAVWLDFWNGGAHFSKSADGGISYSPEITIATSADDVGVAG